MTSLMVHTVIWDWGQSKLTPLEGRVKRERGKSDHDFAWLYLERGCRGIYQGIAVIAHVNVTRFLYPYLKRVQILKF